VPAKLEGRKMILDERKIIASICRESFFEFVKEFWPVIVAEPLDLNWHLEFLCRELQTVAERVFHNETRKYDLIVNIPPGMSKSTIVSQLFPAWVWTRLPSARFICVSYAATIAVKDSLKTRDLVESEPYKTCFPGLELREDVNTKGLFENSHKGFRLAAGVLGAITGRHGHFLLVDDPLNPEQAYSEAELKTVNRWMRTTLPSRRMPKHVAPIILIQQRLSIMDPTGEMVARYAKKPGSLRHICLPGELTEDVSPPEIRKNYVNGLLDPRRLSREVLDGLKGELGLYGYTSQILQSPVPSEGGMFEVKKLNIAQEAPRIVRRCRSWDKAATEGGGKYSTGIEIGMDEQNRTWILNMERGQWSVTKRERVMRETAERDGLAVPILIEIEPGSGGKESGETSVRNLRGFRVLLIRPTGEKETRAYGLASQVGAGNVFVLNRGWTEDFVEELRYFPNGKFSDQVDAASQGFNYLAKKRSKVGGLW